MTDTSPPSPRTSNLSGKAFVERPKFLQGVFQGLWVLYLLTRGKCQVSVFHAEVCPNTLTCCWQRLKICVGCCNTKPIATATITFDCNTAESSMPLAMFMKRIWHFIKLPLTRLGIPFTESECNAVVFHRPPRTSRICYRLKLVFRFPFGFTAKFIEKTLVCRINASEFFLNRLTRQRLPMWVCCLFQHRKVCGHGIVVRIRQAIFISLVLPPMEIVMHLPHIVKQIADTDCIRLAANLIFIDFHGISSLKSLTPDKWVGRHVTLR